MARRAILWPLLALPGTYIVLARAFDHWSYGETIHQTGLWSVGLLCAALLATPLKRLFPRNKTTLFLLRQRRAIGVSSFGYAAMHTAYYLHKKWPAGLVIEEGQDPSLLTGWIAFTLFITLAATSNNYSVRKLVRRWKTLHRLVYIAAALTFAHWVLAIFDPTTAIIVGVIICLAELARMRR